MRGGIEQVGAGCVMASVWKTVPQAALASLPPRGQAWEVSALPVFYEAQLAGHAVGGVLRRAAAFLKLAAAEAALAESVANAPHSRPTAEVSAPSPA